MTKSPIPSFFDRPVASANGTGEGTAALRSSMLAAMAGAGVLLGVLLAHRLYWGARGFFYDEAWVALSVREPTLHGMLFYDRVPQTTPAGLLLLMRILTLMIGDYEWVYRLPALVAAFGCLPLLAFIARRTSSRASTYAALIFAAHPLVAQYSQEAKPYAIDMLGILALLLAYLRYRENPSRARRRWLEIAAIVGFAFSYVIPFGLAGIIVAEGFLWYRTGARDAESIRAISVIGTWLFILYLAFYAPNSSEHLRELWPVEFPSGNSGVFGDLVFVARSSLRLLASLSSPALAPVVAALIVYGVSLQIRARQTMPVLFAIGVLAAQCLATMLRSYPFSQTANRVRLQLYFLPLLTIVVAVGLSAIEDVLSRKKSLLVGWRAVATALAFLAVVDGLRTPTFGRRSDFSQALAFYKDRIRPGEDTLVSARAAATFSYYVGDVRSRPATRVLPNGDQRDFGLVVEDWAGAHAGRAFWFIPGAGTEEPGLPEKIFRAQCQVAAETRHFEVAVFRFAC